MICVCGAMLAGSQFIGPIGVPWASPDPHDAQEWPNDIGDKKEKYMFFASFNMLMAFQLRLVTCACLCN